MFVTAQTCGWNSDDVSIMNEEISHTVTSPGFISGTAPEYGTPILPTTQVRLPAFLNISPSSVTVVVFPFVPVMAVSMPMLSR